MHAAAFRYIGLDGIYLPFDIPPTRLSDALEGLQALGWRGCNVTIPYKQSVLRYVARRSSAVQAIGAANTLTFTRQGMQADNTDAPGFLQAWNEEVGVPLRGLRVAMLGAGGAARALLYSMLGAGAHVHILARRPEAAQRLATDLGGVAQPWPVCLDMSHYDALVQTTPVGMHGHADVCPVALDGDLSHRIVWDAIYNPGTTPLLELARQRGARTFNGLYMLAAQAALAFERWTGQAVPTAIMLSALATP
jgi:shikimate dehydrogenase